MIDKILIRIDLINTLLFIQSEVCRRDKPTQTATGEKSLYLIVEHRFC